MNEQIDQFDIDNNQLLVRSENVIKLAQNYSFLSNVWFILTGNRITESEVSKLVEEQIALIKSKDIIQIIDSTYQLLQYDQHLSVFQRFSFILGVIERFIGTEDLNDFLSEDKSLGIVLLMPLFITLATGRYPEPKLIDNIQDSQSFVHEFWNALQPKANLITLSKFKLEQFMSLLIGGFGVVTPTTAAIRFIASTKSRIGASLVGSFCATGPSHMGACKFSTMRFVSIKSELEQGNIELAAKKYCTDKPWPGFGHPVMLRDPRCDAFFDDSTGSMAPFKELSEVITNQTGLKPNVDFMIGSVMSKLNVESEASLLGFFSCRIPTLIAHYRLRYRDHSFGLKSEDLRAKYKKVPESWL
ncbi:citrate/2-methylcitrate synthase [Vibrio spartinae]|uniref:citrate synthase (unknown stereospecificity) n=1 Tax=Vibrio spartinae TaxID=1918945 RepID=A0A1N6M5N8_9VIBR|nr:citrate/2-methylcitrate synthase [Vibrio spartinae]SIO94761.1 citrate synthase [Vibrio spartinae]